MMDKNYLRWSKIPYSGEKKPPSDPVTPLAGSWSLIFLKRDKNGSYLDPKGRKMQLPIAHPNMINFNKELLTVQKTLKNLTDTEKKIAIYFGTGVATKQWTPVIDRLIDTYGVEPTTAARILSAVHAAINDTMIIVWDLKYKWDVARPNQYDPSMQTLLCTPRFPTYPSGHATMSGCAAVVLSYFFPTEAKKLQQIAESCAISRLYGGVHFPADNNEALKLGKYIGKTIVNHLKTHHDSDLKPIDLPNRKAKNANIFPNDYQQFIPFEFHDTCTSLLLDKTAPYSHKKNNKPSTKPKLFF